MSPPWMPLYIADYRLDTARLGAAEHGAYLLLIMEHWAAGSLPDDDRELARIACMSDREWRTVKPRIQRYFFDGWKHKRVLEELERAAATINKRRAAAEQMHANRRAKADALADAHAPSNAGAGHDIRAGTPSTIGSEPNGSGAAAPKADLSCRDRLWSSGLDQLAEYSGKPRDSFRSIMGKWLKAHEPEHVEAAVLQAHAERSGNPVALVNRILTPDPGASNGSRTHFASNGLASSRQSRPTGAAAVAASVGRYLDRGGVEGSGRQPHLAEGSDDSDVLDADWTSTCGS